MAREYLKDSILVCSRSSGKKYARRFTIKSRINENNYKEGSTVVCYNAYDENSGMGILKEFYPVDSFTVKRRNDGQLVQCDDSFVQGAQRFEEERQRYVQQHKRLLEKKRESSNEMLASFIPVFEIYTGCDEDLNEIGTTYIWTPQAKVMSFEEFCEEIRRYPEKTPEYHLFAVLKGIESLTKCIGALHREGLIHRDIKPSNFGFQKRGDETLTQTLTMFDIDSICSVFDTVNETMGTVGYMEPEALRNRPTIQTDIYSIGATLFQAICITADTKKDKCIYHPEYYQRLEELVDGSLLIKSSEANSNPNLRSILAGILKKCLAPRKNRYIRTEDLLADLEQALFYVMPAGIARKEQRGEKWVLTDARKALDQNKDKNSALVIRHHLYEYPLYACEDEKEKDLNVLMLGLGGYGQKFLDICLQAGQMRDRRLHVTTVSANPEDLRLYQNERPGLSSFFTIDGKSPEQCEPYGDIKSITERLDDQDEAHLKDSLERILQEHFMGIHVHYIFIALGDDARNQNTARICWKYYNSRVGLRTQVHFVREGKRLTQTLSEGLAAVYVNEDARGYRSYEDIERMAYNAHCIWETEKDDRVRRKNFRQPYHHDSSVDNVLSLKYKLHSIGIDLGTKSFEEAAVDFASATEGSSNTAVRMVNDLLWLEHRRWCTEKACTGWTQLENLSWCLNGEERDNDGKRNICIIPSDANRNLAGWTHEQWDTASEEDMMRLDPLDRMSVQLHRIYAEKAKELRRRNVLGSTLLSEIRTAVSNDPDALCAYREWYASIQDIWNREENRVHIYKQRKTQLENSISALPENAQKRILSHIVLFDREFYVMYKSMEYRSWKENDTDLIRGIPYILTHTGDSCFAIPLRTESNDAVFSCAAAPLLADPARVVYLCYLENRRSIQEIKNALHSIVSLFDRKPLRTQVSVWLLYRVEAANAVTEQLEADLKAMSVRIDSIKPYPVESSADTARSVEDLLRRGPARKALFGLEKNSSGLSYLLDGAGIYDRLPAYRCDAENRILENLHDCEPLQWIKCDASLTVNDIASFCRSRSNFGSHPEFYEDYEALWKVYTASSAVWKNLCMKLEEYADDKDRLCYFPLNKEKGKEETLTYVLPSLCSKAAAKLIGILQEEGCCEEGSAVYGYTSDACEVVIKDRLSNQPQYDRLFASVYSLMDADAVKAYRTNFNTVQIEFNNLQVKNLTISGKDQNKMISLLEYFRDMHYLTGLRCDHVKPDDPNSAYNIFFTYASRQIKDLLTNAGRMLEVYVYHKARALNQFDDVTGSFEVYMENSNVLSELDCVVTRGFRTIFIECKARREIDQGFYYRIKELTDIFGINAVAVLIADTREKGDDISSLNQLQRARGEGMQVITVYRPDEIDHIGDTLVKIIEGTYKG